MSRFENLSDFDFEVLVADLLGKDLGRRFETFPRGADGGIDLRSRVRGGFHIVQCKHYEKSGFGKLETAAKKERKLLGDLRPPPARYTFVTSRRLTAANKAKLIEALHPFAHDESDVLGEADLLALLRSHPEVERTHVKLWLRSTAPLQRIVNADVFARSEALVADITATLPRYVQTASFAEARERLVEHNVVIVAGPPGVGKTTLARLLLMASAESDFVPYSVQSDVSEAWKLFQHEERQVFFFDDFLGRTSLFDSVSDDARDLAGFIKQTKRSETTRLILATREYVLQQARQEVEDLKWHELEADKFALTLKDYTRFDRAHIFYNHVYFSPDVDAVARASLLRNRSYRAVIDHEDYSPRLIEWMTGMGGYSLSAVDRETYAEFCVGVLNDPESLWTHAYERGLSAHAKRLLLLLPGLPVSVEMSQLETAFASSATATGSPAGRRAFETALKLLQDSFVRVARVGGVDYVSVLNPSLIDFAKATP